MRYSLQEGIDALVPYLEQGKLIVFVGSGISVPSELPTWDELLTKFVDFCEELQDQLPDSDRFDSLISDAKSNKKQYPVRVASALKSRLVELNSNKVYNIFGSFADWFLQMFTGALPNENHQLITATSFPHILTSNYDTLLEQSARKQGFKTLPLNSFTFKEADKVAAAIYEGRPTIIHIHGKLDNIVLDDFVFTAQDYVRIKRKYPGFTLALQALFLNYSILFVGYGGSDPHLEDFVEEVSYFLEWSTMEQLPRYFLVLRKDKAGEVLEKYKDTLRTHLICVDTYDQSTEMLGKLQKQFPRAG